MITSRIALMATAAAATTTLALWWTAAPAPAELVAPVSEGKAFAALAAVAASHRASIPDGVSTYSHFGDTVLAHAPLAGIEDISDADLAEGARIMAVFVHGDRSGRVPDGAYVVRVQLDAGSNAGTATYLDAEGQEVAIVDAVMRTRDEINALLPGTYGDPPPDYLPTISSTHVWVKDHWGVDCTGPGWNWNVIYY